MRITSPIIATKAVLLLILKFTKPIKVPVSVETIPAFARPIIVINKPIPTVTAFFKLAGIDLIIASRTPKRESKIIAHIKNTSTEDIRKSIEVEDYIINKTGMTEKYWAEKRKDSIYGKLFDLNELPDEEDEEK